MEHDQRLHFKKDKINHCSTSSFEEEGENREMVVNNNDMSSSEI